MHSSPQSILIVRLSHLGDVATALPVLGALRRVQPRARIGWVVQPEFAGLLAARTELDVCIHFDRRGGLPAWMRLQDDLARFAADWTIDAQGNLKSALVALSARAARRSGLARADWTEPLGARSLNDPAPPAPRRADGGSHVVDKMLTLARHVAPGVALDPLAPCAPPATSAGLLLERLGATGRPPVVLQLAAPDDVRSWPGDRFARLAVDLARDHAVVLAAGPAERALGQALARQLAGEAHVHPWIDGVDLADLVQLCAELPGAGGVFVGCDSGPLHVAWSSGARTVLLAGPQDHRRTGPWPVPERETGAHRVVHALSRPACAPCLARTCDHPAGNVCMQRLDPERVAAVVRRLTLTGPRAALTAT